MDQASHKSELLQRINDRTALVGIVGLGYVGLPLAKAFIDAGFRVLGYDTDPTKIDKLSRGESYIGHLADEWLRRCVKEELFLPTGDAEELAKPDAILICVPTPLSESRDPDLRYVEATVNTLAAKLRAGQLIVLESTTYPGTTRDVMLPVLTASGLRCGEDFFLAYSPEREDPGNPDFSTEGIPKVVGGQDQASLEVAEQLYTCAVSQTVAVSSCEVAEACKILENTYRAVNIALVNELKKLFERLDIDVWEVIEAAKTKPFGFQAFYPGPGLGGHCIPIDPFYLSWLARKNDMTTRFIELTGEVNTSMPDYVIQRLVEALNDVEKPVRGSKIAILGMAYKPDVDDPRESPSFRLYELLAERGAELSYNDPYIPVIPSMRSFNVPSLESSDLTPEYLQSQDCVLLATNHACYDYQFIADHSSLVIDTRNAMKSVDCPTGRIVKA